MPYNPDGSTQWLLVAVAFGLAECCLQLGLLSALPFRPVGDESEYIDRARSGRPFAPRPFFRLPALPALAWFGGRLGDPAPTLRLISIALSAGAMAATAGAAARLGGPVIASLLCTGLLLIPERAILGSRIWPDVHLAAITSGIVLVLSLTPSPIDLDRSAGFIGVLVAVAVLVRLDALFLAAAVPFLWAVLWPPIDETQLLRLIGPALAVFGGWWLIARVVMGQRWPDTTWIFNLGVSLQEVRAMNGRGPIVIDNLIERQRTPPERRGNNPKTFPWTAAVLSVGSRLRALTGPDTFVQAKIVTTPRPGRWRIPRPWLNALLRVSVPFLVATAIGLTLWSPNRIWWPVVPAVSLMVAAVSFHARTRYRLPLLYGLVPLLSAQIGQIAAGPEPLALQRAVPAIVAIAVVGLFLALRPRRIEVS